MKCKEKYEIVQFFYFFIILVLCLRYRELTVQQYYVSITGMEPPEKRPKISLKMTCDSDEGEGTLVINTPEPTQTVSSIVNSFCHFFSRLISNAKIRFLFISFFFVLVIIKFTVQ